VFEVRQINAQSKCAGLRSMQEWDSASADYRRQTMAEENRNLARTAMRHHQHCGNSREWIVGNVTLRGGFTASIRVLATVLRKQFAGHSPTCDVLWRR
jgi:hypothetical protein